MQSAGLVFATGHGAAVVQRAAAAAAGGGRRLHAGVCAEGWASAVAALATVGRRTNKRDPAAGDGNVSGGRADKRPFQAGYHTCD